MTPLQETESRAQDGLESEGAPSRPYASLSREDIRKRVEDRRKSASEAVANSANFANSSAAEGSSLLKSVVAESEPSEEWSEPALFEVRSEPVPYPIESLPPILRDAVEEVQRATQAPLAMVACSAICAASAACQALIDVQRDEHLSGPVSLFFIVLGESGERKSTVDKMFTEPLKRFHLDATERSKTERKRFIATKLAWKAKCDAVELAIKNVASGKKQKNGGESLSQLEERLVQLHENEPEAPLVPKLLVTDITQEKLVHQLASEWPSCALISPVLMPV